MIKYGRHPAVRGMTWSAIVGKLSALVVRHLHTLKIIPVTCKAIHRRACEFQRGVALFAGRGCMLSDEGKNRHRMVEIKRHFQLRPRGGDMTRRAFNTESAMR
jgi:hypothetical protein